MFVKRHILLPGEQGQVRRDAIDGVSTNLLQRFQRTKEIAGVSAD